MIFLFLGGFIIAIAIEKTGLHKRIALNIIHIFGTSWNKIILGFMIATAFLSMWISNTATAVMVFPIGVAVISQLQVEQQLLNKTGQTLMLSIAYGCSIGGVATIIGTPTNPIFVGYVEQNYGITISFTDWIMIGLPFSIVMLSLGWFYLTRFTCKSITVSIPDGKNEIKRQLEELGKMKYEEKMVLIVFVAVASLWVLRKYIIEPFVEGTSDAMIAIIGALVLFIIPSKDKKIQQGILSWKNAESIPWGILILFGGGLALASGFKTSGLATWIGEQMVSLSALHILLIVFVIIVVINFLTEISSNVATAAMMMPILGALALSIDVHPFVLMTSATIAASCAFMLPVATPPNAVVFSSGYLKISDMIRIGFWMNIISIVVATLLVYFILPLLWNFKLDEFPKVFDNF